MKRKSESMAFAVFLVLLVPPVLVSSQVFAAGLSAKESDDLRQAKTFYKSGSYQEAADIFARLSAAHPDIPTFGRNAGAAYYYLKKPDPALSNLREYLRVQKNLTDDDRQEVQRWISEMEQLRAQAPIPSSGRRQQPVAGPAAPPTVDSFGRPLPAQTQPVAGPAAPPTVDSFGRPLPAQTQPPAVDSFGQPLPAQTQPVAVDSFGQPLPAQTQPVPGQAPSWSAPGPGQQPVQPGVAEENHPTEQPKSLAPWIIGGAGVACLGLGGLFTYLSQSAFSDTRAQYNPDRESAGRTYSGLQFVGYGLGAAGIVTAIVMLSLERSSTPGRVSLVPAVGPQLAGAQLHVSY